MRRRRLLICGIAAVLIAAVVYLGVNWYEHRAVRVFWSQFTLDGSESGNREAFFLFVAKTVSDAYSYLEHKEEALGLDWDEVTAYYSAKVKECDSDEEFLFLMDEMVSLLDDGHVTIMHEPLPCDRSFPIDITSNGAAFAVTAFLDQIGVLLPSLDIGSELVSLDGVPMAELWEQLKSRTGYHLAADGDRLLLKRFFQEYYFHFRRDHDAATAKFVFLDSAGNRLAQDLTWNPSYKVRNQSRARLYTHPRVNSKGLAVDTLQEGTIGYIRLNTLVPETYSLNDIDAAFEQVADCRGLIIDFRDNGGGDFTYSGNRIIGHLISRRQKTAEKVFRLSPQLHLFGSEARHYPGRQASNEGSCYSDPVPLYAEPVASGNFADKPVVLLVNEFCFSSADMFISAFADLHLGKIVGRIDRLHSGQPLRIEFPGTDWGLAVSSIISKGPAGEITEGRIVPLYLEVPLSRDEILGKGDPILEAGIRVLLDDIQCSNE